MSVTIRDVAHRAGVSIATVSRVLNGTSPVKEDKRQLVLEAAETLGYAPNPAALSLRGKQIGGLGVLLPFVSGEFFSELLGGMDEGAQDNGFFLIVSTSHRRPSEFREAIAALNKRVDGLVVMAPELDHAAAASILHPSTPVVFLNTYAERLQADVFNFDNAAGARLLAEHLLGLGHRRIAFVHGPPRSRDAQERARGFRAAMGDAGLSTGGLEFPGGYTREAGYIAATAILERRPRPTAVIAVNDYCAFGLISAFHRAGVRIPDEVSVAGFDGLASTQYTVPPLTTVRVPVREMGYHAVERLAERLQSADGAPPLASHVVPIELVARASTAPPSEAGA